MGAKGTRRNFLRTSGAVASTGWTSTYAAGARSNPGPNDTINLALIGCGARGRGLLIPRFQTFPGVRFVAVCDVNSKYLAEGRKRAGGDPVAAYKDYRKLLDDRNIDAVIIATNQQWHVLPMIAACRAGKDVYLEKPLGNSIGEGPFAVQAWVRSAIHYADRLPPAGAVAREVFYGERGVDGVGPRRLHNREGSSPGAEIRPGGWGARRAKHGASSEAGKPQLLYV